VKAQAPPTPTPTRLWPERPWREDVGLYRELLDDPAVAATLRPGALGAARTLGHTGAILTADIEHWQRESFGPWLFFDTATGMFVGRCGLRRASVLGRSSVELLYAVRSGLWGAGYATEMAMLAMVHARRLGLEDVVGFTAVTNRASRRVLEKVGMRYETTFEHAGLPHWLGRSHLHQQTRSIV
jgi:RimJ/RimL family protein N-acetyltransferase